MGFFCRYVTVNNNNVERQKTLRADKKARLKSSGRRILSASPAEAGASMTVEAALVLPVFIFCMVNILMLFQMEEYNSRILAAVHQTGNRIARTACMKEMTDDTCSGTVLSASYIPMGVSECLGSGIPENGCIRGGKGGLSYIGSEVLMDNDIIDIRVSYHVVPAYAGYGWNGARMRVRYYGRGWTGYDTAGVSGDQTGNERMVFITKTGTVYHLSRKCSRLCPSVRGIPYDALSGSRNTEGMVYSKCPYCSGHVPGATVYVTDYGKCYHTSPCCRGLKRTVYTVPLSEAGGRGPCAVCGGGN